MHALWELLINFLPDRIYYGVSVILIAISLAIIIIFIL